MYMWIIEKIPNWSSKRIIIKKQKQKNLVKTLCFYLKFYKNQSLIPFE